jgi:3-oxoacyl-[acyl-carrier protein] reductase
MMSMTRIEGVALVTGAGAGLGKAAALTLGQRGARVAVHYMKSRDGAEEVVAALKTAGTDARAFQGDLTKEAGVQSLVADVSAHFGDIDILVNNTGDLIERKPLLEMSLELFQAVMDVNLTSTFLMCRAVAPGMVARKRGVIVNMASLAAWNGGGPGAGAYSASKGAIVSLTKALAREVAPLGIRVNCVAGGVRVRDEERPPRPRRHSRRSGHGDRVPRLPRQFVPDGRNDRNQRRHELPIAAYLIASRRMVRPSAR